MQTNIEKTEIIIRLFLLYGCTDPNQDQINYWIEKFDDIFSLIKNGPTSCAKFTPSKIEVIKQIYEKFNCVEPNKYQLKFWLENYDNLQQLDIYGPTICDSLSEKIVTNEIWPIEAKNILKEKEISELELISQFTYVYFPWTTNYDLERTYYSLRIEQRPLIIFKPISTLEIENIINFIYKFGLTVRIFNGKHSTQILAPEVMVDMSYFNNIFIDNNNKLVSGGGATQGGVNYFLYKKNDYNFISHFGKFSYGSTPLFPSGTSASVGITGISCIGGVGIVRRTFGLTIDYINEFTITVPPSTFNKSKTLTANNSNNSDLFWSLLGGGANNFGFITEIKYDMIEINKVIKYSIVWDFSIALKKLSLWQNTAPSRNNKFTEAISASCRNGVPGISVSGNYVLSDGETETEAMITVSETLSYLGGNLVIDSPVKYSNLYKHAVSSRTDYNFSIIQSSFTDSFDNSLVVSFIQLVSEQPSIIANSIINIDLMGGEIQNKNVGSFGWREKPFFLDIQSNWNDQSFSQYLENWIKSYYSQIINENDGIYLGFPVTFSDINYSNFQYFNKKNYPKLQEIKQKYDPFNILTYSGTIQ